MLTKAVFAPQREKDMQRSVILQSQKYVLADSRWLDKHSVPTSSDSSKGSSIPGKSRKLLSPSSEEAQHMDP